MGVNGSPHYVRAAYDASLQRLDANVGPPSGDRYADMGNVNR